LPPLGLVANHLSGAGLPIRRRSAGYGSSFERLSLMSTTGDSSRKAERPQTVAQGPHRSGGGDYSTDSRQVWSEEPM